MAKAGKTKKKEKKDSGEKKKAPAKKVKKEEENIRGIVRLAGQDMDGHLTLRWALTRIRGIGLNLSVPLAKLISKKMKIDDNIKVGQLSDEQIEEIDKILFSIHENHEIPRFMFNRLADPVSGKDTHLIMNDLIFAVQQDIEREKKIWSWRGFRHAYGQKVRGQRTKNTGRRGMTVGVIRRATLAKIGGGQQKSSGSGGQKKKK